MKTRKISLDSVILVAAMFCVCVLYLVSTIRERKVTQEISATASDSASGSSVFFDLKLRQDKNSAESFRRPLLSTEDLKSFDSFFLLSPRVPISEREKKILNEWVDSGGDLVMSFDDDVTYRRLEDLIRSVTSFNAFLGEKTDYKESQSFSVASLLKESEFSRPGENYEFYSRLSFQDSLCVDEPYNCYVRVIQHGNGRLIIFAGLAPFSNGLIAKDQNSKLAARLAVSTGRAAFDDYHLFITEKGWQDLATEPTVIFPFVGLLIGLLLYFFLGSGDFEESALKQKGQTFRRTYHSLNREILHRVVEDASTLHEAAELHSRFLKRLFPRERAMIDELSKNLKSKNPMMTTAAIRELLAWHKAWLKTRSKNVSGDPS